jgi:ubiquinone/menaquinone biosynthesis C-methylase UbiE
MSNTTLVITAVIGVVAAYLAVNFGWRWMSRRFLLPCPSWLSWSLEGGFVDWWAGTQRTLDRIGLKPGDRVLEVGPGPGRLLIPAAARVLPGGEVVGLDVQQGMIDRLKQRAVEIHNLTALLGNAEGMSFDSASFDVAYLAMVLGEIPHREAALAECFRVLRPGGRLSITEMAADPHFQSRATLTRLATAAGFEQPSIVGRPYSFTANFVKPRS